MQQLTESTVWTVQAEEDAERLRALAIETSEVKQKLIESQKAMREAMRREAGLPVDSEPSERKK